MFIDSCQHLPIAASSFRSKSCDIKFGSPTLFALHRPSSTVTPLYWKCQGWANRRRQLWTCAFTLQKFHIAKRNIWRSNFVFREAIRFFSTLRCRSSPRGPHHDYHHTHHQNRHKKCPKTFAPRCIKFNTALRALRALRTVIPYKQFFHAAQCHKCLWSRFCSYADTLRRGGSYIT